MLFYCPNCRNEYEAEPVNTITTNSGRVAYKANCPNCGQDLAEFVEEKNKHHKVGGVEIDDVEAGGQSENRDKDGDDKDMIQDNDLSADI